MMKKTLITLAFAAIIAVAPASADSKIGRRDRDNLRSSVENRISDAGLGRSEMISALDKGAEAAKAEEKSCTVKGEVPDAGKVMRDISLRYDEAMEALSRAVAELNKSKE